jgi:hypothetical protein
VIEQDERNPYFSATQWGRVLLYLLYLRADMGLGHWRLELSAHTPAEEHPEAHNAMGYVIPVDGRYIAWMYLAGDFPEVSPFKQRHILVHELCHLYTRDSLVVVETGFKQLGEPVYNSLWAVYKEQMEYQVDEIARTMAPQFRMPQLDKPLGAKARKRLARVRGLENS